MRGIPLNFSGGLNLTGDTVFINLNSHHISDININLKFSVCRLTDIRSSVKQVNILTGLYSETISVEDNSVTIKANQPQGNICLFAPQLNQD